MFDEATTPVSSLAELLTAAINRTTSFPELRKLVQAHAPRSGLYLVLHPSSIVLKRDNDVVHEFALTKAQNRVYQQYAAW